MKEDKKSRKISLRSHVEESRQINAALRYFASDFLAAVIAAFLCLTAALLTVTSLVVTLKSKQPSGRRIEQNAFFGPELGQFSHK